MIRGLLNKKVERILDLITLLEIHDGRVDFNTVYRELDSDAATLAMDLSQAKSLFAPLFTLQKDQDLQIQYLDGNTYLNVYAYAMTHSPVCALLEQVFFQPQQEVPDMARALFVSTSTVYRWVDQFNQAVRPSYDVSLDTHPLHLCGDENEVRTFYTSFFKEKYPLYEWPFPALSKSELSAFLDQALPLQYAKNFLNYYQCFHIQLAVSLYRYHQGFRLPDADLKANHRSSAAADILLAEKRTLSLSSPPFSLSHDHRLYQELIAPFAGDLDAENFSVLLELTATTPLANRIFLYINRLISYLFQALSVQLDNESELVLALYNALMGTFGKSIARSILYSPYLLYQKSIQVQFPDLCNRILAIIRTQNQAFSLPTDPDFVGYLFYVIWSTWENLFNQLIRPPQKIKILVISRFSLFHARSLRQQILTYFGNLVDVSTPSEPPILLEALDLQSYDLIVSNFKIEGLPLPCVVCDGIHSYRDYAALARAIFRFW